MSKKLVVKYYANSKYAREPLQVTEGSTGYDLFADHCKTLFPGSVTAISAELRLAIPKGYFGRIYPRSGILKQHFISCDGGVVNQDFRGEVVILMTNHSSIYHTVKIGHRIAQIVLHKKMFSLKRSMIQHC